MGITKYGKNQLLKLMTKPKDLWNEESGDLSLENPKTKLPPAIIANYGEETPWVKELEELGYPEYTRFQTRHGKKTYFNLEPIDNQFFIGYGNGNKKDYNGGYIFIVDINMKLVEFFINGKSTKVITQINDQGKWRDLGDILQFKIHKEQIHFIEKIEEKLFLTKTNPFLDGNITAPIDFFTAAHIHWNIKKDEKLNLEKFYEDQKSNNWYLTINQDDPNYVYIHYFKASNWKYQIPSRKISYITVDVKKGEVVSDTPISFTDQQILKAQSLLLLDANEMNIQAYMEGSKPRFVLNTFNHKNNNPSIFQSATSNQTLLELQFIKQTGIDSGYSSLISVNMKQWYKNISGWADFLQDLNSLTQFKDFKVSSSLQATNHGTFSIGVDAQDRLEIANIKFLGIRNSGTINLNQQDFILIVETWLSKGTKRKVTIEQNPAITHVNKPGASPWSGSFTSTNPTDSKVGHILRCWDNGSWSDGYPQTWRPWITIYQYRPNWSLKINDRKLFETTFDIRSRDELSYNNSKWTLSYNISFQLNQSALIVVDWTQDQEAKVWTHVVEDEDLEFNNPITLIIPNQDTFIFTATKKATNTQRAYIMKRSNNFKALHMDIDSKIPWFLATDGIITFQYTSGSSVIYNLEDPAKPFDYQEVWNNHISNPTTGLILRQQNKIFLYSIDQVSGEYSYSITQWNGNQPQDKPYFYLPYDNTVKNYNMVRIVGKQDNLVQADVNIKDYAISGNTILFNTMLNLTTMNNQDNNKWYFYNQTNNAFFEEDITINKLPLERKELNFNINFKAYDDNNKTEAYDLTLDLIKAFKDNPAKYDDFKISSVNTLEFIRTKDGKEESKFYDKPIEWVINEATQEAKAKLLISSLDQGYKITKINLYHEGALKVNPHLKPVWSCKIKDHNPAKWLELNLTIYFKDTI